MKNMEQFIFPQYVTGAKDFQILFYSEIQIHGVSIACLRCLKGKQYPTRAFLFHYLTLGNTNTQVLIIMVRCQETTCSAVLETKNISQCNSDILQAYSLSRAPKH